MRTQVIEKMAALIVAAFGLIAALAWNEAIKTLFSSVFGVGSNMVALFVYAIIVTVIAVAVTIHIGKISEKGKK